ncbi:MAG TPA: ComF family protein [Pyrinomonadaceae bacterium]|nr:ComF family protein [Pyrinomonadaceae bacterium]
MIAELSNLASQAFDAALALVYPEACAVCGASVEARDDGVACARCWDAAPLFRGDETLCWKCGALSSARVSEDKRENIRCGRCDDDSFTVARACGLYEGALRVTVLELKRQPHITRRLAEEMYRAQQRAPLSDAELIVPVPLHHSRERERGFNQALILARALARRSHLGLDEHSLVRQTQTKMHRAGMDAKARRQSMAHAFSVRHSDQIKGKRVMLIDDVFTTGATVSACADVLKAAGADRVFVLTIARATSFAQT